MSEEIRRAKIPRTERCEECEGYGYDKVYTWGRYDCEACGGSGLQSDFVARVLSGEYVPPGPIDVPF